jgi:hypothetical protein
MNSKLESKSIRMTCSDANHRYRSEQERLKIIAENEKLLTSLGLNGFSSNAPSSRASSSTPASKRKAPANGKHEPTKKKAKIVAPPPARLSMRLRGQQAKTEEDVQAIEVHDMCISTAMRSISN